MGAEVGIPTTGHDEVAGEAPESAVAVSVEAQPRTLALVLSGGGVRAMAFHLGVLRFLAERSLLERVSRVSTVSGGSLLVGLMLQQNNLQWPSSVQFTDHLFGRLREDMCRRSLMWAAIRELIWPWNWVYLLSRAELVSKALRSWGINCSLAELPQFPEWSINGTTAENGRRFRFKRDSIGDYQLGYARADGFPLSKAMAVSAAFPGGIGPLSMKTTAYSWKKRASWDTKAPEADIKLPFKRLRLYDGGVYDNLGLEPYFDIGQQQSKIKDVAIYVSDAGAPLAEGPSAGPLSPWRVKRLADIMSEQSRTLRVRAFLNFLDSSKEPLGAYVYIAGQPQGGDASNREVAKAFPTNLERLTEVQFDAIAGHGYAVAQDVERVYGCIERLKGAHGRP